MTAVPPTPPRPGFTFTTSSVTPVAHVRCHGCGWTVQGQDPAEVFPLADLHACAENPR